MRINRVARVGAVAAALALAVTACGDRNADSGNSGNSGASGGIVAKAKNDKKLTIGIKYDQPGIGLKTPDGKYEGFDVDVARYIAKELGVEESGITWKEAKTPERENLIEKNEVDFVSASYSMSDARRKRVAFVGPYYQPGQDLLVKAGRTDITDPEKLNGKKLCSVKGSTSAQSVADKYAKTVQLQEYTTYSECLTGIDSGLLDAATTDNTILAGYAKANPGKYKVVGRPFTTENIGIGLSLKDAEAKTAIYNALKKLQDTGEWKKLMEKHFAGAEGYTIPAAPPAQFTDK
ncbi:amino acid ABC transporter substrate-binding protein (PAAT family) [Herbihabitans rhizosphaerae]|uniref:Amino acid ABC transporter substrate-binding protein (PAAT family) n=1 Tax=Herbihabitans rhizosphaerae TaxID=1872711 RepID=A0A4Q7KC52_9PSEU|nr:glutamate ABC transporter substrate-binding protein [Herbihabitans rhizosphaerae]RZS30558.1 amino acid ABC transporter substrate-binding protein (PAAT family) [Herbihabitans rhizosphaerae]